MGKELFCADNSQTEMIKLYSDTVYRLAFSLVRNRYDADDIHQEVFVRFLHKKPEFANKEHERAWFIRVTVNCCKNYCKTAWKRSIGGCAFSEYDEAEGKIYFYVNVRSDQAERYFAHEKLTFSVRELLTGLSKEEKEIDLSQIEETPATKRVDLSGYGGNAETSAAFAEFLSEQEKNEFGSWWDVLDLTDISTCAADDFTVTGVSYSDGLLKVQICMGDNTHADRHVRLFLTDDSGEEEEQYHSFSVSWREETRDTRYTFYEYYFEVDREELDQKRLYGTFHNTGESIRGDWKITFRVK